MSNSAGTAGLGWNPNSTDSVTQTNSQAQLLAPAKEFSLVNFESCSPNLGKRKLQVLAVIGGVPEMGQHAQPYRTQ